ncbi:MAG: hypothetical protein ACRDVG_16615 [Jatrophihabitantaceae bacterium]
MATTRAAIAELTAKEASELTAAHPQLARDQTRSRVLAISVDGPGEVAALADLIAAVQRHLHGRAASVRELLDALLPATSLTVSAPVLAQVRRNAEARQALIDEFGLMTSSELARLNHSRAANAAALGYRLRKQGRVFAVEMAGDAQYPGFEFTSEGKPLPVIAEIIAAFGYRLAGWDLALWFTGCNGWLGGVRPVDAIRGTDADRAAVIEAAQQLAAELDRHRNGMTEADPAATA